MFTKIYYWLHRQTSGSPGKLTYSSGYWQEIIRRQVSVLCQKESSKVLEVGCGEGLFLIPLAKRCRNLEAFGVDNSADRIREAGLKSKEYNLTNINLSVQDARSLAFDNEYFNTVICINVLFNLDSLETVRQVLTEMRRVCEKGGRIIFDIRNSRNPLLAVKYKFAKYYDETVKNLPLRCYTYKQMERILSDLGLRIEKKIPVGGFLIREFAPIFIIEAEKLC